MKHHGKKMGLNTVLYLGGSKMLLTIVVNQCVTGLPDVRQYLCILL